MMERCHKIKIDRANRHVKGGGEADDLPDFARGSGLALSGSSLMARSIAPPRPMGSPLAIWQLG